MANNPLLEPMQKIMPAIRPGDPIPVANPNDPQSKFYNPAEIDYNQYEAGFREYLKQNPASPGGRAVQIYPGGFQTNNTGETAAFNRYLSSIGAPIPASNTVQSLAPPPQQLPQQVAQSQPQPQQVAQSQPQPQRVVQPVSQAETIKESREQTAGLAPGVTPALPAGTAINPKDLPVTPELMMSQQRSDLQQSTLQAEVVDPQAIVDVAPPLVQAAEKYTAQTVDQTPEGIAAQGKLSSEALIGDVQGSVSQQAIAQAATGEVDQRSTVKYQLGELFKSFEEGREPPAWASPAIRAVTAQMQARGLGASSMAAAAITQAITEAGIPIAKSDADRYAQIQLSNLNNQQQAVLQNAATFAAMDKANLDSRLQGAVNNAKSFLSIDLQNLQNQQKIYELDYSGRLQALFKDSAAVNASRQFNAESQTQVNQFYDSISTSLEEANISRRLANQQFNVSAKNAVNQYVQSLNDDRQRFNVSLAQQIDQSNVQWRRDTTTANTAADNEAERINAQNLLNLTQQAQSQLWQKYRDDAAWTLQYANSKEMRAHQLAMLAMEQAGNASMFEDQMEYDAISTLGTGLMVKVLGL